ncbi:MAG TPA: DEAD/DEAH box helicase family protein [Ruminococcus flavefaciens]|nr:DEAD/DEAH box helicase family protein [Ruminococcus flavefaciens]
MNKTFSWENFPKAFLVAVLQRKDVPEGIRITDDSLSMLRLSARMDRFCKNPDIAFVKTFRREIEKYIFDNERYLTIICSKLKLENYAGIKVDSIDKMHNSIAALDMNRTIASLYSNILQNIGLSIEADELNNFYLNKKKLDLSAIIPSDISLEYYQKEAVSYLREFYNNKKAGLLVMPTGSGKTRTAVYFLLRYVISQGYQVIWLAHRSLLLEQTANTFYRNASLLKLAEPERKKLTLLCISSEHCSIHQADKKDDIIIGGVQSLSGRTDTFSFFLRKKS